MSEFKLTARDFHVRTTRGSVLPSTPRCTTGFLKGNVGACAAVSDDEVIAAALRVLSQRMTLSAALSNPRIVREYLSVRFAGLDVQAPPVHQCR